MRRVNLPPDLGDSFSIHHARQLGVSPSRLRASDLEIPFRGVRSIRTESPETLELALMDRAIAYSHRMTEHEFFSHVTAAVLWGLPLPRRMLRPAELDVAVLWPRRAPAAVGARGHALRPRMAEIVQHPPTGLRVASPASTWAMLSSRYRFVDDAVVVADAAVRVRLHRDDPPALCTTEELQRSAFAGRRVGGWMLREALPLTHTRSRSRTETLLRLVLVRAGLEGFEVNFDVFDADTWLAQVDIAYPEARVALEYEGEHHLTNPEQWAKDIARVERLTEAGWRVIRVTKADLSAHPYMLATRVRRALASAR